MKSMKLFIVLCSFISIAHISASEADGKRGVADEPVQITGPQRLMHPTLSDNSAEQRAAYARFCKQVKGHEYLPKIGWTLIGSLEHSAYHAFPHLDIKSAIAALENHNNRSALHSAAPSSSAAAAAPAQPKEDDEDPYRVNV